MRKVRFTVEFSLPDRLAHPRSRYREQLEAMLGVFCPRNAKVVDEAWQAAEKDAPPLPHVAEAVGGACPVGREDRPRHPHLRLVD